MASQPRKQLTAVPLYEPVNPQLQAAFVVCHAEGHQWRHEGRVGGSEPGVRPPYNMTDAVARYSVCTSCTSERFRWYTRNGQSYKPIYRYAEGYLHKKTSVDDEPAPTRQWWRQQVVISLFEDMVPVAKTRRRRKAS